MALGPRQRRLYKNLVDIYSVAVTLDPVTGRPTDKSYTLEAAGVKCLFGKRDSTSTPTPGGRQESDNLFTHDTVHFGADVVVKEGWVFQDKSVDRYGNQAQSYGQYWIVVGEPKTWSDYGGRRAGHVSVQANRHSVPHESIG